MKKVSGEHVLYHYLQKDLLVAAPALFQRLVAKLVVGLGIWLRPELYARLPFLLPFAVRDPNCRPRRRGDPDHWGKPDPSGLFRDDNSMIKNAVKSLQILSPPANVYGGCRLGNGFVASHVWRNTQGAGPALASHDNWLNSFVPNLVWLPTQVSKLTDRPGFTQDYLQAISAKIYRGVQLPRPLQTLTARAWARLPVPGTIPKEELPDLEELSFFGDTPDFVARRVSSIRTVVTALAAVAAGKRPQGKVVATKYTQGLPRLPRAVASRLASSLGRYLQALGG